MRSTEWEIKMKKKRQEKLLELISSRIIDTQEDMQSALRDCGFDVTQATVSRDIKELRIVKATDSQGRYRYISHRESSGGSIAYHDIFSSAVIKIESAMNDVVIKCHPGMASGACAALDNMKWDCIVGTLAGDDTILVITRNENAAYELVVSLKRIVAGR